MPGKNPTRSEIAEDVECKLRDVAGTADMVAHMLADDGNPQGIVNAWLAIAAEASALRARAAKLAR